MIYARLAGGLGNQLFQLAAALTLQQRVNKPIVLFTSHLAKYSSSRTFMLDEVIECNFTIGQLPPFYSFICRYRLNKILPGLFPWHIHNKNISSPAKRPFYVLDDYFHEIDMIAEGMCMVSKQLQQYSKTNFSLQQRFQALINGLSTNQIAAVHIRRSDYITKANRKIYCYLDNGYYERAIAQLPDTVTHIFVFTEEASEDLSTCTQKQIVYVRDKSLTDVDEFLLMGLFNHFIVANSTFSFWAAYASTTNKGDVGIRIAPKNWFCDPVANRLWEKNFDMAGFITV